MKSSISTSKSQPSGNTKKNRISQTTSSNPKNKVEDHARSVKSSSNKKNRVVEPFCDVNVKHTKLNANSKVIFVKSNKCMFDVNHDMCFLEFVNDVNVCSKSKSVKKSKNKNIWKLTRKVFTDIGFRWKPTGRTLTIVGNIEDLGKLKPKADIGIFVGYAPAKKAFQIYNKRTRLITETIHVDFDELTTMASEQFSLGPRPQLVTPRTLSSGLIPNPPSPTLVASPVPAAATPRPADLTSSPFSILVDQVALSLNTLQTPPESQSPVASPELDFEESSLMDAIPTNVHIVNQPPEHLSKWSKGYLLDNIESMQEKLNEFEHLEVWELVPHPDYDMIITLKLIFKVKLDELGAIKITPTSLQAKESSLRAKAGSTGLYDLLSSFLLFQKFSKVIVDPTLLTQKEGNDILLVQIYVDDIIFASADPALLDTPMVEKSKLDADPQGKEVDPTRYCEMIGSLMYLTTSRPDLYSKDSCIALTAFADADHAGCQDTRRSTSGSMHLLGDKLVSWSSKKQKSIGISSIEAEYISLTEHQLADIFTKALGRERLDILINKLGMRSYRQKKKKSDGAAREEKWVPKADRVKISSTNMRIDPTMAPKEETYQVIFDVIKNTSFYKAFLASADFKLANKKCLVDVEVFRQALDIYLKVLGKEFIVPPYEEELLTFLIGLGYKGVLTHLP
ncbi:retrovirus-related pol polyprotein from transposon TNT 1-94 [Tanacetum coccineum]